MIIVYLLDKQITDHLNKVFVKGNERVLEYAIL